MSSSPALHPTDKLLTLNAIEWFRMVLLIMEYGFEILVFEEKKSKSKYHKSGFATLSSNSWLICSIFPRSYASNQFPTANILLRLPFSQWNFIHFLSFPLFESPEQDPQKRIAVIIAKLSALCLPGSGSTNTVGILLRFAVCGCTWEVAPPAVPLGEIVFGPPRVRGGGRRPRLSWNKDSETCVFLNKSRNTSRVWWCNFKESVLFQIELWT